MKVYTIRFQKIHEARWESIKSISATSSSVACMSQVEISAVSSSSSSPGNVSVLSKQTLHYILKMFLY